MLYGHKFGVTVIDEAAKMRNPNHHWTTMNELSRISHATIAVTATPITNSPMVNNFLILIVTWAILTAL